MDARKDLLELVQRTQAGHLESNFSDAHAHGILDSATARKAAVLLLFGRLDAQPAASHLPLVPTDLDVLLVERASSLNDHPGQVAFPGGGVDQGDKSVIAAALREAEEETGLDPSGVEILGELLESDLPVSNFQVTPVVGWWQRPSPIRVVDHGESARVFRVPVGDLLDPANRYTAAMQRGRRKFKGPAFVVDDVLVWGFTAGILDGLFDAVGWSVPWDPSREVEPQL